MEHIGRDDGAPVPPVQTDAEYEEMENTIRRSVAQTQSEDAPLPLLQIAALVGVERGDAETDAKKKPAPTTERDDDNDTPPTPPAASSPRVRDEAVPTPTPRQQPIIVRLPPQSMLPSPDEDTVTPSAPVPAPPTEPSPPVLRATLVEDRPEAIVVPDLPVYDAVQVAEQTSFEKNKKLIIGVGVGLLIGAVAAGVSVGSNNSSSGSNAIEPGGVVLSTARPSESSSPSEIPSLQSTTRPSESSPPSDVPWLRQTLGPSRSLAPSTNPSQSAKPSLRPTASSRPSQIPSHRPSSMPTPTPPLYCGEINILTDRYPNETSWEIRTTVTNKGISFLNEVVLEGAPEEIGRYTYEACLERGDYEFAIGDSGGDGIDSPGYYNVTFGGQMIAQGGEFGSKERVSFSLPSWNRQGLGFNGNASGDLFGLAVAFSADASTMAIGAPGPSWRDDRPGYVKVYSREGEGSSWEQRGDTLRGEAIGDNFGRSLALSEDGTTLSIGAPRHDSVGSNSGQVKVYEWNEATLNYTQIGDTLYGAASGDRFGYSLDITNGKILAVGADESDTNGSDSGQVTIYAWDDASSNFKQRGEAIDGDAAGDSFGFSVSLTGNGQKLAVGAPFNDSNGRDSGQVRVFEWDEATSNYEQLGDSLLGNAAGDGFGWSVSFSRDGTTLAVGAPYDDDQWSGQVKVFAWDKAASNFEQIGQSLNGKAAYDYFGQSVALSSADKTLAVGAPQFNTGKPGYVEVYGWDEAASEYKRLGQRLGGEASDDFFGDALALAGNGTDLAIGAPPNDRNGTNSGRVEVFDIEL